MANINKRLLKKSGIYFIGNLSSKIMSAMLVPIYAFYVEAEDLGMYDYSQTVMGILAPIIIVAIWEAILRFLLTEDDKEKKQSIISTTMFFSIFMSAFFVFLASFLAKLLPNPPMFMSQIILMIVLHSLVYVWQYSARGNANNKLFVVSGIVSTVINFLLVLFLVVYQGLGLLGLYISYNLGQLSTILVLETKLHLITKTRFSYFDYKLLKRMLIFSSPLVLNLISAWFISGFGRTIITTKLGSEANGMYSFANKFSMIIVMVGSVITMAIIEEAILSLKGKGMDPLFAKTIKNLFILFLSLIIIAMPMIRFFYGIISDTDYVGSINFVPGLLLYAVFNTMASNVGSVFQAINKTGYQFTTTLLGGIATFVISWSLIGVVGIHSVVAAQIIGALVMLISRYVFINRFIEFKINWLPITVLIFVFFVVAILSLSVSLTINFIIEVVLFGAGIYFNRQYIKTVLSKIRRRR